MELLVVLAILTVVSLVALPRVVRQDGLGTRTPPRSHRDWWE
ncbi:type II secretion system protein [Isoptericola cucumis]|nr:type II secretion system protein [Isoptericola cucumis]